MKVSRFHKRIVILLVTLYACVDNRKVNSINIVKKQLSSEQLIQLVEDTMVKPRDSDNIHIFYKEYLNDSTWILMVYQNQILGNETFGVCQVLKNGNQSIFVYGGESCHFKLNDSLKSKNDEWPIQLDGISFLLLVEEREGLLGYYTLNRRLRFNNNLPDSSEVNLMELH